MQHQEMLDKHFNDHLGHHNCGGNHHHHHGHSHDHQHGHSHDHHHHHSNDHHSHFQSPYEDSCCSHDHSGCGAPPSFESLPQINTKFLDKSKYQVENEIEIDGLKYVQYKDETQMPLIMNLITKDLSEPYSIYTYRYFIHNWPFLCFLVSLFLIESLKYYFDIIKKN